MKRLMAALCLLVCLLAPSLASAQASRKAKLLLTVVDQVVTVMNPGGAGHRRFDLPASVGIMELEPGIPPRARLVPLTGADEG